MFHKCVQHKICPQSRESKGQSNNSCDNIWQKSWNLSLNLQHWRTDTVDSVGRFRKQRKNPSLDIPHHAWDVPGGISSILFINPFYKFSRWSKEWMAAVSWAGCAQWWEMDQMRRIKMDLRFLNLALYLFFLTSTSNVIVIQFSISTHFLLFQRGYCPLNNISCFQSSPDATSYDGIFATVSGRKFRNKASASREGISITL